MVSKPPPRPPGSDSSVGVILFLCVAGPDSTSAHEKNTSSTTTEINEKITTELELEDEHEENSMTVYVKTISGKTISITCDKRQKEDTVSEKVEMKTSIPRGITYLVHQGKVLNDQTTIEENNTGAEATIGMSQRLIGGMDNEIRRKQMKRWTHFCRQSTIQSDPSPME